MQFSCDQRSRASVLTQDMTHVVIQGPIPGAAFTAACIAKRHPDHFFAFDDTRRLVYSSDHTFQHETPYAIRSLIANKQHPPTFGGFARADFGLPFTRLTAHGLGIAYDAYKAEPYIYLCDRGGGEAGFCFGKERVPLHIGAYMIIYEAVYAALTAPPKISHAVVRAGPNPPRLKRSVSRQTSLSDAVSLASLRQVSTPFSECDSETEKQRGPVQKVYGNVKHPRLGSDRLSEATRACLDDDCFPEF